MNIIGDSHKKENPGQICARYNLEEATYLKLELRAKINVKLGEREDIDTLLSDTTLQYIWIHDPYFDQQFISPIINVEDKGLAHEALSTHKKGPNGI
ncbi:MAG: hypothetical protein AAF135_23395 [Bacteroidota bacterium]